MATVTVRNILATAAVALTLSSCIRDRIPQGADLQPGDRLPDFSVIMSDGTSFSSADLDGKVSLIMFFHTGCPDCQAELPVVQQIHEEFGLQIAICCISREEGPETVRTYWLENGLTLPYSAQEDRSVYSLFAGMGVPRVYVSGRDRVIYSVYDDSPIATPDQLEADIRACL